MNNNGVRASKNIRKPNINSVAVFLVVIAVSPVVSGFLLNPGIHAEHLTVHGLELYNCSQILYE